MLIKPAGSNIPRSPNTDVKPPFHYETIYFTLLPPFAVADDEKRLARNIKDVEKHTPKQNSRTIFGFFKKWCNELENGGGGLVWKLKKVLSKMLFDRVDKCCRDMGYRLENGTLFYFYNF